MTIRREPRKNRYNLGMASERMVGPEAADIAAILYTVTTRLHAEDPAREQLRRRTEKQGLPQHQVDAATGRLLELLARVSGARRAVEIGTLGGYSAAWLARGLAEGGRLDTIERDAERAALAEANLREAGLAALVRVHAGEAVEILRLLEGAPYDLCFFDGGQLQNCEYLRWALDRVRPGGLVILDDAYRFCELTRREERENSPSPGSMREFLALLGDDALWSSRVVLPLRKGVAILVRR